MCIERVIIENYRTLQEINLPLREHLNIIVGDNETGKSTLLEAINLALKCQINRKPLRGELHSYLFNASAVAQFLNKLKAGQHDEPPKILIELYLRDCPDFQKFRGTNNSLHEDAPGISLTISLDSHTFAEEYAAYIAEPERVNDIPVEYYKVDWKDFSGEPVHHSKFPVEAALIDPSAISNTYAANKYVLEIARDFLDHKDKVELALAYRTLRTTFLEDKHVTDINKALSGKASTVTQKTLTMALDMTAKMGWEAGIMPHLDDIPLTLIGKGEQNSVKIKLAIEAVSACILLLIEEPENHLSHSNLNKLISHIETAAKGKQLIITTHSSFVLNKLGIENVMLFDGKNGVTLSQLPPSTEAYFRKLPGHDTLRMILAQKTILVEGPSDELIVQKAYKQKYGKLPLEDGVEVITVRALASKRFLDIAKLLDIDVRVVTDNDGDIDKVKEKFDGYDALPNVKLCYSDDPALITLENHMLASNGLEKINWIFTKKFMTDKEALDFMTGNKTDVALKIFDTSDEVVIPGYIEDAIA
jgi:putative ATP-dependent endonuclease of OLD family